MSQLDYYSVLNLSKDATEQEIKSAFRKLAKQYHPDINKTAGAENKFKEINEAYSVLSDPEKRSQYDRFGHSSVDGSYNTSDFNPFDIFNQFFNQNQETFFGSNNSHINDLFGNHFNQSNQHDESKCMEVVVAITFIESIKGCNKIIRYKYNFICQFCQGTRAYQGNTNFIKSCSDCQGTGVQIIKRKSFFGVINSQIQCQTCDGNGKITTKSCDSCNAKGYIPESHELKFKINPGVQHGETVILKDEKNNQKIEFHIQIKVRNSEIFERHNWNIYTKIIIEPLIAIMGGEVKIPTPWGIKQIKVKAGTKNGEQLKIKGLGVTAISGRKEYQGDMIGVVEYSTPAFLNQTEINLLKTLNIIESPETRNWINKAKKEIEN